MFLRDSDGKKSATVTISIVTFVVVMVKVLIGGGSITIGSFSASFGDIGSDVIIALLGPTLGAYSFRRYTDKRYSEQVDSGQKAAAGAP